MKSHAPTTQDEYIAGLPAESRGVAERLRATVHTVAPEATETIKYGIPAFLIRGSPFVYFAVWKKHVGIYPIYQTLPELEAKIAPYRHGTDTVRFSLTMPLAYELVTALVRFKREHALARDAAQETKRAAPRTKRSKKGNKE